MEGRTFRCIHVINLYILSTEEEEEEEEEKPGGEEVRDGAEG